MRVLCGGRLLPGNVHIDESSSEPDVAHPGKCAQQRLQSQTHHPGRLESAARICRDLWPSKTLPTWYALTIFDSYQ